MTNKKFKLAAMSLATAVAVSAVGPSASAVTYYLGDGSVTVDKDDNGAFSYQVKEGESADGSNSTHTYVNEDTADKGVIYVKDGNAPEVVPPSTDNSDNGTEVPTPTDNDTQSTDAEGNTKLIWGNYEKQAEGAPSAYDMVYGTEYEYEGKTYTIVWGYESQNNPNTTAAAGVLDAFGPDSNVKVTGDIDGTDSAQYTVTIYGALREVTDPVIPTNPKPETPEGSDPTPPAPTTPTTPAVQDARPTTPTVEQAVAKTTPAPESGKLIQTGTTNWMADVLVRAGGVLLAAGYLLERKRKSMFHKAQH